MCLFIWSQTNGVKSQSPAIPLSVGGTQGETLHLIGHKVSWYVPLALSFKAAGGCGKPTSIEILRESWRTDWVSQIALHEQSSRNQAFVGSQRTMGRKNGMSYQHTAQGHLRGRTNVLVVEVTGMVKRRLFNMSEVACWLTCVITHPVLSKLLKSLY